MSSCFLFTTSMPLMILQITVISFFIHGFFEGKAYRLLCHSLYHRFSNLFAFSAIIFSDLGDTSLAYSIQYVGILWIYMTNRCLFYSCVLCFPFSCSFLVISGTLLCWLSLKTELVLIQITSNNPADLLSLSSQPIILYKHTYIVFSVCLTSYYLSSYYFIFTKFCHYLTV